MVGPRTFRHVGSESVLNGAGRATTDRGLTEQAMDNLSSMQADPMISASPQSVRNDFSALREILSNLSKHIPPDMDTNNTCDFWHAVLERCSWFFVDPQASAPAERRGKVALQKSFARLQAKSKKGEVSADLGDLQQYQAFKWLMTDCQRSALASLVKEVLASCVGPATAAPAKRRKTSSGGSPWDVGGVVEAS